MPNTLEQTVVKEFSFLQDEQTTLESMSELNDVKSIRSGCKANSYFVGSDFNEFDGRAVGRGNVFPMNTSDELYSLMLID